MSGRKRGELPIAPDAEAAADLEIQNHIAETMERLVSEGMSETDARAEAMRRFGSVGRVRGTMVRETRSIERRATLLDFLLSIPADLRYAWRGLRSNPLFALIVIGTLGLGMGAAATGFTVVDALLLRPLPYLQPDRLVDIEVVEDDGTALPVIMTDRIGLLEAPNPALKGIAFYDDRSVTLTGEKDARSLSVLAVSATMDEVIGLRPYLGRAFDESDMVAGTHRAMVSYDFWKTRGGRRDMIGSSIRLDNAPYEVVGILPRNFKYPVAGTPRDVWVALTRDFAFGGQPLPYVHGVARLADGVTLDAANARLAAMSAPDPVVAPRGSDGGATGTTGAPGPSHALGASASAAAPAARPRGPDSMPLHASAMGRWRGNPELVRGVWLVMGAVVLMLLVAMVNAMNLILFRGADRTRELAVRLALGVSRMQLLRHILVENVLIALLSGATAVVFTVAGVAAVNRRLPQEFAFSSAYTFQVSTRVLTFTFLLACTVGLILGLLPAIRSLRLRFVSSELTSARGATRGDTRLAQGLVIAEVALAVTLLAGAGLLANSFMRLTRVDPGMDTDHLAIASLSLPSRYASPEQHAAFFDRLEAELERRPSIAGATVSVGAPPNVSFSFGVRLQAENGQPLPTAKDDAGLLPFIGAAPDFVSTTGITILNGRDLTSADVGTRNVLIDSRMADALWGHAVSGHRFRTGADDDWFNVVGVYRHLRAMGLDDRTTPYGMIRPRNPRTTGSYMSVMVRTRGNPGAALPIIRNVLRNMDPDIPAAHLETARDAFSETIDKPRFLARVMTGISTVALILAAIGVYGVLSYSVSRRRREMGIRMALGAPPMGLRWLFLRQGLIMAVSGLALGLLAGLWMVRFVRTLLYALAPNDPATFMIVAMTVLAVATLASLIPARMAARMSPAAVLRMD